MKEEDGKIEYKAVPKTAVGEKLITTGLIATIFSDSTYTLTDGVQATEMHYFSMKGYSMHIFVFEVDLSNPKISIEVSTPNGLTVPGQQRMTVQATYEDALGHMVWGGVNGDFANGSPAVVNGIVYKNGVMYKETTTQNFFAITKDKNAVIGSGSDYNSIKATIQEGCGGGVLLASNGVATVQTDVSINPRTCVGVTADHKKIYFLVIDGRNYHYSNGMMYTEEAKCLLALGASDGLNLDGGGSSTFFIRKTPEFTADRFQVRNWPSDNGGMEREVANGLVIISK